jgi:RND family efflux transporter MFP subunit
MKERMKLRKVNKRILIPVIMVAVLASTGLGYILLKRSSIANTTEQTGYQTAQVRRGTLTLSASGTGSLVGGQKTNLSFTASGTVASISVAVGDKVTEGQELARIADISTLQSALTTAELDLKAANQNLEEVKNSAETNLANAALTLANAQKELEEAQSNVLTAGMARCDQDTTDVYYAAYMKAQEALNALDQSNTNQDYYLKVILPAKTKVEQAYATYQYCAGYTQYEIDSSQATLTLAEAAVKEAEDKLAELQANNGIDPSDLAIAETSVAAAQIAYDKAFATLKGTTIYAPFDGTILSIEGEVGDEVGTGSFITIADLVHPEVEFWVDETDLDKVSEGASAKVTFDAIPNKVFEGTVTEINPTLQTMNGYQVVQGVIQLDLSNENDSVVVIEGLNASVEVIGGEAENALLVPVEAVHDLGDDQYGVFVVGANGKLTLTVVEIGLSDSTYTVVTSGLKEGDVVTTGILETQS